MRCPVTSTHQSNPVLIGPFKNDGKIADSCSWCRRIVPLVFVTKAFVSDSTDTFRTFYTSAQLLEPEMHFQLGISRTRGKNGKIRNQSLVAWIVFFRKKDLWFGVDTINLKHYEWQQQLNVHRYTLTNCGS